MLSKACEYALKAMIYLAQQTGNNCNIATIAAVTDSPIPFTAKILQQLSKAGLVNSVQGAQGGFYIDTQKLKTMTLFDIVNVIDGDALFNKCVLGLNNCSEDNPCPAHHQYRHIKKDIIHFFESNRLLDFAQLVSENKAVLKN